ncbi:hypothetical protein JH06_4851 [Blastocystis sp. subtype 4]|uniref:hypothetical protein n=1 Tax=Blastocystis sp. subtype 4 TaxID=944170 RepID=UPI0007119C04|nr:hypothetical protein JH06_4851 [Blastocystis sp. subtype 4]KNB41712.1 hypothetical protein JH06_4851 [Blastocystis sp. subtype 4]|eukprot:XP_014525155.1 hypothetical protein JH06_4851 [Blastocystis sp. subtype 4]
MSDYPQQFLDLADYLQIATELQNGDAAEKAASYWARWYWVKKAGEKYTSANSNDPAAYQYLSTQISLVQQMKGAVPSIADKKGKELMQQFIARDRKQIMQIDQSGDYYNAATRWKRHVMYLNIAVYSQPEMPQFASLRTKAKTRELEIMKAMQSGTSVPPMSLTASMATSMAASQVFAPQPAGHYSPQPNQYHPQPPAQFSNELASQPEIGGNLPFVPQNYDTAPPSIPMVSQFQSGMSPFPLPNNNDNIMPPFPSPNHNDDGMPSITGNRPGLPNPDAMRNDTGIPLPSPYNNYNGIPPLPSPNSSDNRMPPFPSPSGSDNRMPPFSSPNSSDTGIPPFPSPSGSDNRMPPFSSPTNSDTGMPPFPSPSGNDNRMPPFPSPNNNDNRIPPFPSPTNSDTGMPPIPSPGSNIVSSNSSTSSSYDTVLSGWENNTEGLLNTYNSYAESIKGTAPKVAKALYESMANACRKDPRFQGYCGQFEQAMNGIKC